MGHLVTKECNYSAGATGKMPSWALVEWLKRAVVCIDIMVWDHIEAAADEEGERMQVRQEHAPRSASTSSVWAPRPSIKKSLPCARKRTFVNLYGYVRPSTQLAAIKAQYGIPASGPLPCTVLPKQAKSTTAVQTPCTKSVVAIIEEMVQAPATPTQGTSRAVSRTDSTSSLEVTEVLPLLAADNLSPAVAAISALVQAAATPTQGRSRAVSTTDSTCSLELIKTLPLLAGDALPLLAAATLAAPAVVAEPTTPAVLAADVAAAFPAASPAVEYIKPVQALAAAYALPAAPPAATSVQPLAANLSATSTSNSTSSYGTLSFGVATAQNTRAYQEDRAIAAMLHSSDAPLSQGERFAVAAIFDGHGGAAAAEHLQQHMVPALQEQLQEHSRDPDAALAAAVADLEAQLLAAQGSSGSTLTAVVVRGDTLYIANIGDSRAVLCRSGQALRLTTDHAPNTEQEKARIFAADPTADITADGYCYGLGVSRDLGNYELKVNGNCKGLSASPDISMEQLQHTDDFLVIGSDGIFDTLKDSDAITTVRRALAAEPGDCTAAAQAAVDRAVALGSSDNVTAVVMLLHSRPIQLPKSNSRLFRNRSVSSSSSSDGGSSGSSNNNGSGSICNGAAADSSTSHQ